MSQLEHIEAIEKRLWSAADNLRANSNYASNEYFMPVMGLVFLRQEGMRLTLDENGLTALTLLIAESDPKAKDLMVRLVMNLLAVGPGTKGDA